MLCWSLLEEYRPPVLTDPDSRQRDPSRKRPRANTPIVQRAILRANLGFPRVSGFKKEGIES